MNFLNRYQWKHYLPAAVFGLLAFVAVSIPALTVFLAASILLTLGVTYAWIVFRVHQAQNHQNPRVFRSRSQHSDFWNIEEPSFRNVTGSFFKTRGWYRDMNF